MKTNAILSSVGVYVKFLIQLIILSSLFFSTNLLADTQAYDEEETGEVFEDGMSAEELAIQNAIIKAGDKAYKSIIEKNIRAKDFKIICDKFKNLNKINSFYNEKKADFKLGKADTKFKQCEILSKLPKSKWIDFYKNMLLSMARDEAPEAKILKAQFYKNCKEFDKESAAETYEFYRKSYNLPDIQDQGASCIILRDTLYVEEFLG